MVTLRSGWERVKEDYQHLMPQQVILRACEAHGHQFRDRKLGPAATVFAFMVQVLHGNTASQALRHLIDLPCSASAYCKARGRLPLAVLRTLLHWVCQSARNVTSPSLWHGHRVFHIDGSSFSMPDTPDLQEAFGQPGGQRPGCGFPVARLLAMFDAATGMILDVAASPLRSHEMAQASAMHPSLRDGDVLVADRGFCSYAHLALLSMRKLHAVIRMHQRVNVDFTPGRTHAPPGCKGLKGLPRSKWLRAIGVEDQIVEWYRPRSRPTWMTREQFVQLPESLAVRELAYRVETPGFRTRRIVLVTTLLDGEEYPAEDLAELYACRWQVEVNLRHLKQTMGMDVLKCKTPEGVLKELAMFALVYNLVCLVICDAAERQGVPPDRISFVDALRWLRTWEPGRDLIELTVNPRRRGRFEPRVVKRRPKQYRRMTHPRPELRKRLLEQEHAA